MLNRNKQCILNYYFYCTIEECLKYEIFLCDDFSAMIIRETFTLRYKKIMIIA